MYVGFSCIAFFIRNFSQCGIYKVYLELESSDQKRIVEFVPVNIGVIQRDLGATRVVHQLLKVVTIATCWCKGDRCNTTLRVANTPLRCRWGKSIDLAL